MPNVQDIARSVIARTGRDWGYELVGQWVSQRYQELCAQAKFRHLRKLGQLYLPAPVSTGTFTVTLGSPVVTADAAATTAIAAVPQAPDSLVGQWFRLMQGSVWYRIAQVAQGTNWTLTLETPYASDNQGAGIFSQSPTQTNLAYYIVPRFVNLPAEVRQIGTMVLDAMSRPLDRKSEDELNYLFTARFLIAFPPWCYAVMGSDLGATGQPKQVEFYPWPQASTTIHYTYWTTPPALGLSDPVPPTIDPDILRTGAIADSHFQEAAKALREGKVEAGVAFRNMGNQEESKFLAKVPRAIRNDRGSDDLAFILKRRPRVPLTDDPIKGAYENFLARGI